MRWLTKLLGRANAQPAMVPTEMMLQAARQRARGAEMLELSARPGGDLEIMARSYGITEPGDYTYRELIEKLAERKFPDLDSKFEVR